MKTLMTLRMVFLLGCSLALLFVSAQVKANSQLNDAWANYLATLKGLRIQPNCSPLRLAPAAGVKKQGTVILLHGFTACPQQYFEWSKKLQSAGFEVFLPLLPGHGHQLLSQDEDDLSGMPGPENWQNYLALAEQMNELAVHADPGLKIIGGTSVGAAVAVEASKKKPNLYDRMILFSPYLTSTSTPLNWIFRVESSTGILESFEEEWGQGCFDQRSGASGNLGGRAGYCQFTIGSLGAITRLGSQILLADNHQPSRTQVQVLFVENDPVAANQTQWQLTQVLGQNHKTSVCSLPETANHSILSRYDTPINKQWWISKTEMRATDFVVNGIQIPTFGQSVGGGISLLKQCDIACPSQYARQLGCAQP